MTPLIVGIFLLILAVILFAVGIASRFDESKRKAERARMLEDQKAEITHEQSTVLIEPANSESDVLASLLSGFGFTKQWERLLQQAGMTWTVPQLVMTMAVTGIVGGVIGFKVPILLDPILSVIVLAGAFGALPLLFARNKRKKRMAKFEEQFPEALDFVARALRAGHAFQVSLSMLSQESPEPLRAEFLKVYNEQNLGESLPVVLRHLSERVPLLDVKFFVAAELMQRETGGNLGEILTKLSSVIRDRFRLKGQVKAASAHGRITATILTVLPIITVMILSLIAPGYLPAMAKDPDGKHLIIASIVAQVIGYGIMRKIINIKV
jgi:tight adherence protein B